MSMSKNKYYANLIMCQNCSADFSTVNNVFNEIEHNDEKTFNFDIICELNQEIHQDVSVTYVLVLRQVSDDSKIVPLAKLFRRYTGNERHGDVTRASFKNKKLDTNKSWSLEIVMFENVKYSDVELKKLNQEMLSKGNVLNRYLFNII